MPRLFITLLLLMGTALAGLFYLGPAWHTFRTLRGDVENWTSISAELDGLIKDRDTLIAEINKISKEDLSRLDAALPQGPHAADFMVLLENLSVVHGLLLKHVDLASFTEQKTQTSGQPKPTGAPSGLPTKESVKEFPVNFSVAGSYPAFKSFLFDLEKNLRLIELLEISFSGGEKTLPFEFSIKAKTYYQ